MRGRFHPVSVGLSENLNPGRDGTTHDVLLPITCAMPPPAKSSMLVTKLESSEARKTSTLAILSAVGLDLSKLEISARFHDFLWMGRNFA
jgi:hypothetical protein